MQRPRERRGCCVVTIAVGGDGNIGPGSMLLRLIVDMWGGPGAPGKEGS
jgi:hypothetical protein